MWNVYQIVNSVNGKKYYGITNNMQRRLASHKHAALTANKRSPLYASIRKHGWENFSMELLHEGLTSEEAGVIEMNLISQDANCYNLHLGGHIGFDIRMLPEDRIAQWKERLSVGRSGKKPALGMNHTEKNRQLFKEVSRKYWDTQETYDWNDVKDLSFKKAKLKYGISKTHYYRLRKRDKNNDLI